MMVTSTKIVILRRALTAEGVGECASGCELRVGCSSESDCAPACGSGKTCQVVGCTGWTGDEGCCATCVPGSDLSTDSNDYEMVKTGDGWEDVDGDYILEKE